MKNTLPLLVLVLSGLLFTACTGNAHDHETSEVVNIEVSESNYITSEDFRYQLNQVVQNYFELKDALVASNPDDAASSAQTLVESLKHISEDDLSEEARNIWKNNREILIDESNKITGLSDIENQRTAFEPLSYALIHTVEAFGPLDNTVYQQTCPMVGDGSADWLSASEQVKNPYHGDRMLNCGRVVRTF